MTGSHLPFDYEAWAESVVRGTDRRCAYDGATGPAFAAWRAAFRDELRDALGFPAIRRAGRSDLDPRRHETTSVRRASAAHERQTWSVETEPGVRVPFHLLLPASADPPYPVVVALHGHTESGKDLAVGAVDDDEGRRCVEEERRDFARQAVERGFAALAPDLRGFGELSTHAETETSDETGSKPCVRWQKTAQLVGRSLVGERVWDARRLAAFVERREELDADRLALVGHSGGGTTALFAAALDKRFAPVVPCASVCRFEDALVPREHCLCNYVPGLRRLGEAGDVAGLVAPRPLRVVAGEDDPLFPVAGTRRAFETLRAAYRGADAADACSLFVGDGGHRFYPNGVWPFVERHL